MSDVDVAINLGPREARKRRAMGIAALIAGVGFAFLAVVLNMPRWARLFIFLPIWIAGLGLFQAKERTCIALAAKGSCNMDGAETVIDDKNRVSQLRAKARQINRRALIAAFVVAMVVLAFPA